MRTLLARAKKASVGMSEDTLLCLSAPLSLSSPVRALVDSFQSTLTSYYAPPARVADFACISLGQAVRIDQDGGSAISQVKARAYRSNMDSASATNRPLNAMMTAGV